MYVLKLIMVKMALNYNHVKDVHLVIEKEFGGSCDTYQVIKERNALSLIYIHEKWVLKV